MAGLFCLCLELPVKWGCRGNTSPAQLPVLPDSVVARAKWCLMRWHKARSEGRCQEAAQAGLKQNSCSFSTSAFPPVLPESLECVPLACCANIGIVCCLQLGPALNRELSHLESSTAPQQLLGDRAALQGSVLSLGPVEQSLGQLWSEVRVDHLF